MKALLSLLLIFPLAAASGRQLELSGIAANSGEKDSHLVQFGKPTVSGIGVVVDRSGTLWDRGGSERLMRYAADGRLLASYPLPKGTGRWDRIAHHQQEELYLLLGGEIYRLPIDAPPGTPPEKLGQKADHISTSTHNGDLAIYHQGNLFRWNVKTGETKPILNEPILDIYDVNFDEDGGVLLLQRNTPLYLPPGANSLDALQKKPSFGNSVQMIDGYWYGAMGHGTLRRFTKDFEADPGVILGGASGSFIGHVEQVPEILHPCGIQKVWPNLYAISGKLGVLHLANWDPDKKQLVVSARIGSLPECYGIGLNSKGDIWHRSGIWRWTDRPEAPQIEGTVHLLHSQVVNLPGDHFVTIGQRHGKHNLFSGNFTWKVNQTPIPSIPGKSFPTGTALFKQNGWILLTVDANGVGREIQIAQNGQFQKDLGPAKIELASPLSKWTSLASKGDNTLYAAIDGWLVELERRDGIWKEVKRIKAWGSTPTEQFGNEIHITNDTEHLWISDTTRHRVLVFTLNDLKPVAEYGFLDESGSGLKHLNEPATLSSKGGRAVVFDRGNQRLVKLTLK